MHLFRIDSKWLYEFFWEKGQTGWELGAKEVRRKRPTGWTQWADSVPFLSASAAKLCIFFFFLRIFWTCGLYCLHSPCWIWCHDLYIVTLFSTLQPFVTHSQVMKMKAFSWACSLRVIFGICSATLLLVLLGRAAFVFPLSALSNYMSAKEENSSITLRHQVMF